MFEEQVKRRCLASVRGVVFPSNLPVRIKASEVDEKKLRKRVFSEEKAPAALKEKALAAPRPYKCNFRGCTKAYTPCAPVHLEHLHLRLGDTLEG